MEHIQSDIKDDEGLITPIIPRYVATNRSVRMSHFSGLAEYDK